MKIPPSQVDHAGIDQQLTSPSQVCGLEFRVEGLTLIMQAETKCSWKFRFNPKPLSSVVSTLNPYNAGKNQQRTCPRQKRISRRRQRKPLNPKP